MIDLARLRRSAAEWEKYEEEESLSLSLAHVDSDDPSTDDYVPSHHIDELALVRDPFATRERSTLIYNRAFGPLNRIGPLPQNEIDCIPESKLSGLARNAFRCVGYTEFEIKSRCFPFDKRAWNTFRKGGQVLWVWDQKQTLCHGGQHDTQILKRLKAALTSRMLLSEILIGDMRDKIIPRKQRIDARTNKTYFKQEYRKKVMGFESGSTVDFYDKPQSALLGFYGFSSKDIRRNMKYEREVFGYLHRGQSQSERGPSLELIEKREFAILKALRSGVLRAEAVHAAKSHVRKHGFDNAEADQRDLLNGEVRDYDLYFIDYFAIALYSGVNPEFLHPGLRPALRYLDATVWLGQLGRASHLKLVPEICMALHDILNKQDILNNQKLSNPIENEINKIFRWIRGVTNIITNIEDLRVAIESTLAGNEPPVIERKAFGLLARHGGRKPKDSRLSKYINLIEFMDREWTRAIYNCHNRPKEGYEISAIMRPNADIPGATGEDFFIHPFIPWAW